MLVSIRTWNKQAPFRYQFISKIQFDDFYEKNVKVKKNLYENRTFKGIHKVVFNWEVMKATTFPLSYSDCREFNELSTFYTVTSRVYFYSILGLNANFNYVAKLV